MDKNKILEWQQKVRERPKVWAVYERCEGETDIAELYDTKEAAQIHADWLNSPARGVRTRASIAPIPVHNIDLARERFDVPSQETKVLQRCNCSEACEAESGPIVDKRCRYGNDGAGLGGTLNRE
jgi:hypothetical protein